jgi:cytochrome b6-f complex subunit 5
MVEALLSGIILGLVPVSIGGLFTTAYLQYRRGDRIYRLVWFIIIPNIVFSCRWMVTLEQHL